MGWKRALVILAVLAGPASAGELIDRVRLPRDERGVKVATLSPVLYAHLPVLPQIIPFGGGGGTVTITSGTTATSGCTAGGVLHSASDLVVCSDTDFVFATDTLTVTKIGATTLTGTLVLGPDIVMRVGSSNVGSIYSTTANTPDAPRLVTGTLSNAWHIVEDGDSAADFNNGPCGTAACTNPQVIVHDKDQNVTDYQALGLSGVSGGFVKTLTESAATSVVIIPVPAATSVSGQMLYTVHARDATNSQTRSGRIIYNGVAEGTTATCVIGTAEELDNTPTGTLTAAITCTSPANNQIQLLINAASSLTQTTLEAYVTLIHSGRGEPIPQ